MDREALLEKVGFRIKELRKEKNLSLGLLGLESEKERQNVAKLEGKVNFRISSLYKVASALGVTMAYALDINNEIRQRLSRPRKMDVDIALKTIKERIKRLRIEKKLTQCQIGEAFGHERQWFEKIVNGKGDFTIFTLYKIAMGLGVSMSFLLDIHDEIRKS